MKRKAVVLLSGGLDSAVTLFVARKRDYDCRCLVFDYHQRHKKEIIRAKRIAERCGTKIDVVKLRLPWKGSSLLDRSVGVPLDRRMAEIKRGIPNTYVPARNTIFLSIALSYAEAVAAQAVFIGAHHEDSSGYPDCRRAYLAAFQKVIETGTKAGLEGKLRLEAPLIGMRKKEIIELGMKLKVPFELTWSCYMGMAHPCQRCDSCRLRSRGFGEAGVEDPLLKMHAHQKG